jgi:cAMP-dependent protein kinase regulator
MFMALDEQEMEVVIDAMDEKRVEAGQNVITEGERGDELYVVEEGQLDCYKKFVSDSNINITLLYSPKMMNLVT